ncbi:hypothetical protein KL922_004758 [Ogataea haglerorum]|nr:hypothetical protein KL922_004758 [Ogataea haglerorum]
MKQFGESQARGFVAVKQIQQYVAKCSLVMENESTQTCRNRTPPHGHQRKQHIAPERVHGPGCWIFDIDADLGRGIQKSPDNSIQRPHGLLRGVPKIMGAQNTTETEIRKLGRHGRQPRPPHVQQPRQIHAAPGHVTKLAVVELGLFCGRIEAPCRRAWRQCLDCTPKPTASLASPSAQTAAAPLLYLCVLPARPARRWRPAGIGGRPGPQSQSGAGPFPRPRH